MQLEIQVKKQNFFVRLNFISRSPAAPGRLSSRSPVTFPEGTWQATPKHANRVLMGPSLFVRRRIEIQKSEVRKIHGILLDFNGIFRREDRVFGTLLP